MIINFKLLMILTIIMTVYLVDQKCDIFNYSNMTYNIITVLLATIFILIILFSNNKENYKNIDENIFTGIKGRTTMENLQKLQDNEIQNLESQVKLVKSFLKNKNIENESQKYLKIPIKNSCITLNSLNTTNLSRPAVPVNQNKILLPASTLSKNEISKVLNNDQN